ncbi:MAG: HEPN domain-containing protein [Acidithiobacillus sp.]|jgi:hypothetical protein|nr:HEPN domain-containing protein [Acidithiobacillus sp.]
MQRAIDNFLNSMDRVDNIGGLYRALSSLTTGIIDKSDLLRAQIVMAVSALDYYIHEATVIGMIDTIEGRRPPTKSFDNYRVSVRNISLGTQSGGSVWFENDIRERHGFASFQQPDKIADAIHLFSTVKLWSAVALKMTKSEKDITDELRLIILRRNKIAHEADMDPSYPGTRWPIHESEVVRSLAFLRELCMSIHNVII